MSEYVYQNITPIERNIAEEIFKSSNKEAIINAMVSVAFFEKDWHWAQEKFIELFNHQNIDICCMAATCLGHIVRIHHKIEKDKILKLFESRKNDRELAGCISDAIDDINMFIK